MFGDEKLTSWGYNNRSKERRGVKIEKDLLGIYYLSREEILNLIKIAFTFKEILQRPVKKVPTLRGKTVCILFYEPSTRTRISFEIAAKNLSCDVINISPQTSSIAKGESIKDTAKTLEAMGIDCLIVRHSQVGIPHLFSKFLKNTSVINAGDGAREHPTQALIDTFTLYEIFGESLSKLKVAIVGDILHSRVARSFCFALTKLGAEVRLIGPPSLLPKCLENLDKNIRCFWNLDEGLEGVDVVVALRLQFERQRQNYLPSILEYKKYFCITKERLKKIKKDVYIMHPGPVNRDIEIEGELVDSEMSLINKQVTNGLAVRMAILYSYLLKKGGMYPHERVHTPWT